METSAAAALAIHDLNLTAIMLGIGVLIAVVARFLRTPDVALLLIVGMIIGPAGFNWVDVPIDSEMNQLILIFGSAYILYDGGASLRLSVLKQTWITITVISTIGVLITGGITATAAHYLMGLAWPIALLLGAVIASTDPATLVPVFRPVVIRERVAQTVMSESAFNDAMAAIFTFTLLAMVMGTKEFSASAIVIDLFWQSGIGVLCGAVVGYVLMYLVGHPRRGWAADHASVLTLVSVIIAYISATHFHASGFMAVFVLGIFMGNQDVLGFIMSSKALHNTEQYTLTTAFVMRVFIFVLLGSHVDFALIMEQGMSTLWVVLIFMLVARPVTVFICAGADRRAKWTVQEMLFMSWTRETGVIPGALAGILMGMNVPGADVIASVTLVAILVTILVQATTTRWLAEKLDLLA